MSIDEYYRYNKVGNYKIFLKNNRYGKRKYKILKTNISDNEKLLLNKC